jgi:hypothetical protein
MFNFTSKFFKPRQQIPRNMLVVSLLAVYLLCLFWAYKGAAAIDE